METNLSQRVLAARRDPNKHLKARSDRDGELPASASFQERGESPRSRSAAAHHLPEEIFFQKSKTCFHEKRPMTEDEEAAQSHTFLDFSAMFVQELDCHNVPT